ncbi:hypothetical protein ACFV2X_25690 [Streptomyces sp. NPDC059679]|uniref:hypothetical protein n=1 Tax=Streptomyces sp. NPDC059679 TaxID=3346903 RepID=UPI00369F1F81
MDTAPPRCLTPQLSSERLNRDTHAERAPGHLHDRPVRLGHEPSLAEDRPGLLVIAEKGFASKDFASKDFETDLAFRDAELLCRSFKREKRRKGEQLLKPYG